MQDFRNWRCEDVDDEDAQCDAEGLTLDYEGKRLLSFVTGRRKHLTRKMSVDERQANQRETDEETV